MDDFDCPWTLIGGIAAAILGKPRFTADVDAVALVKNEEIAEFLKIARKHGLTPRLKAAEDFARKNRVILLKHGPSGIGLDISLGRLPFEVAAIKGSKRYKIGGVDLRLPRVEDLIIFKSVAHRPQDMIDIQEMIKLNPNVDEKYLRDQLQEFSRILDKAEIWDDVKAMLKK
ncbi:MAG: hypothetical protein JW873_03610 [Candidatus Saganbacteria bacterium]|nr:hypothetical protein [Candidatus Saganbacteria bacterium]